MLTLQPTLQQLKLHNPAQLTLPADTSAAQINRELRTVTIDTEQLSILLVFADLQALEDLLEQLRCSDAPCSTR